MKTQYIVNVDTDEYIDEISKLEEGRTYKIRGIVENTGVCLIKSRKVNIINVDLQFSKRTFSDLFEIRTFNSIELKKHDTIEIIGKLYITTNNNYTIYTFISNDSETNKELANLSTDKIKSEII